MRARDVEVQGQVATKADVDAILHAVANLSVNVASTEQRQQLVQNALNAYNQNVTNTFDRFTAWVLVAVVALVVLHYTVGKTVNRFLVGLLRVLWALVSHSWRKRRRRGRAQVMVL